MARSPSASRNHPDCLNRTPRRACRCPSRRRGPRKDQQILSRIEEQINLYQAFGSLDTELTSSIEGPQSPESIYSFVSQENGSSVTNTTADLEEQRHTSPPFVATPASSDASFVYPSTQYYYLQQPDRFSPPNYPSHSWTWPPYGREGQSCTYLLFPLSPVANVH